MKHFIVSVLTAAAVATPVLARQHADGRSARPPAAGTADMTDGEIRKVDKSAARLTIRHGDISSLGMPGMTMVFQVKQAGWLDKLNPGDKVRFRAEKSDTGFVVTAIEAAE